MKEFCAVIILILVALFFETPFAYTIESIQYELTPEKVKRAWVVVPQKGRSIGVLELKKPYKKEFANLTKDNIGKKLDVMLSDQVFVSGIVGEKIDSGRIRTNVWFGREEYILNDMKSSFPSVNIKSPSKGRFPVDAFPNTPEMEKATIIDFAKWFVTEGIAVYYQENENFEKIKNYADEKGISISTHLIKSGKEEDGNFFSSIRDLPLILDKIDVYPFDYISVVNLQSRVKHNDIIYELWSLILFCDYCGMIYGKYNEINMFATETQELTKKRKIIKQSDKFFHELSLNGGVKVKFPFNIYTLTYLAFSAPATSTSKYSQIFQGTIVEELTTKNIVKSYDKKIHSLKNIDKEITNQIYDYSRFIITKATALYYKDKDFEKMKNYIFEEKGLQIGSSFEPAFGSILNMYTTSCWLGKGSLQSFCQPNFENKSIIITLVLLDRMEYEGRFYEFWVVEIVEYRAEMLSKPLALSMRFFATETESLTKDRNVVYEHDKFFREFSLSDGTEIKFLAVKILSIPILQPWIKAEAFKGSELEGISPYDLVKFP